jgi:putative membrane protein
MRSSGSVVAALGAALAFLFSTPVYAQQGPAVQPGGRSADKATGDAKSTQSGKKDDKGEVASGDRRLMTRAAQMGIAEVEASKVATVKASSPEIKKFAEHMVKEHEKANSELQQIASSKGVNLPSSPDSKHQEAVKELRGLSGDKFDRKYMEQAGVKDHKSALSLFQEGAKNAKDPQLKAYFEKHVPHIKQHLAMAQDLASQADGGEGKKKSERSSGSGSAKADRDSATRSERQGAK